MNLTDIARKSLGDTTSYAIFTDKYDPTLLNPMPRKLGRKDWDINETKFKGYDVWNCHEASFLTNNGLPVAGTLKFCYSSDSEMMVESKSMKLFLNSFDMCRMGNTIQEASSNYCNVVERELEKIVGVEVSANFFINDFETRELFTEEDIVEDLFEVIPYIERYTFDDFQGKSFHLEYKENKVLPKFFNIYTTNILRSRCRHTLQKDTGTAFIVLETNKGYFEPLSILKQIVSLRECNEFHELLAEKLICDFLKFPEVIGCTILLMYNRRGSLDINPIRTNNLDGNQIVSTLINPNFLIKKTQGQ